MVSAVKFDKWQTTNGVPVNSVLQVVTQTYNAQVATSSTSYVDLFRATIVPKASNSKFSVETICVFHDGGRGWTNNQTQTNFRLYNSYNGEFISFVPGQSKSYTDLGSFWGWDAELGYSFFSDEANAYMIKNFAHIGEWTGSKIGEPITVTLQWRVFGNTAYFNRVHQGTGNGAGVSTIRIMEIAQ